MQEHHIRVVIASPTIRVPHTEIAQTCVVQESV
jgi:hypothetical protein